MLADLVGWFQSLDATFTFLLLLPLAVAIAGLAADLTRRTRSADQSDKDGSHRPKH